MLDISTTSLSSSGEICEVILVGSVKQVIIKQTWRVLLALPVCELHHCFVNVRVVLTKASHHNKCIEKCNNFSLIPSFLLFRFVSDNVVLSHLLCCNKGKMFAILAEQICPN